jgi:hypothetical protein
MFSGEYFVNCNSTRNSQRKPEESFLRYEFPTETLFRIASLKQNNWHVNNQETKTSTLNIIRKKVEDTRAQL